MRRDEPANVMHLIKPLLLMVALLIALAVAEYASAETVRVHDVAGSEGPGVTLDQIAELTGDYAPTLGGIAVGRFEDGADSLEIEMSTVREVLVDAGAAVGRLDLQGYAVCKVHRLPAVQSEDEGYISSKNEIRQIPGSVSRAEDNESPAANFENRHPDSSPITVHTPTSVRGLIADQISRGLGVGLQELDISFSDRDTALLDESVVAGRYTVEPLFEPKLGRQSFRVRAFHGTREIRQQTIQLSVSQRMLAVVAVGEIERGEIIHRGTVRMREVLIDNRDATPITDLSLVIGQVVSRRIAEGELVTTDRIAAPLAVRRRDTVEVTLDQGGLRITFNGEALGEGSLGQAVIVRNPETRQEFNAVVTGYQQVLVSHFKEIKEDLD
ncbi:MAG: flagellar basal body P-ring formation chaperone FlgA [Planctomycetota bacterium]